MVDNIGIADRAAISGSRPLVRLFGREGIWEEPDLWTNPGAVFGRRMRQPGL